MAKSDNKSPIRGTLSPAQQSLFVRRTQFFNNGSLVRSPFQEMMIGQKMKSGRHATNPTSTSWFTNPRNMELPSSYKGAGAKTKPGGMGGKMTRHPWQAFRGSAPVMLKDFVELHRHFVIVAHQIPIASERWKMVLAQRALAVFKESFIMKRFNSKGGKPWKSISRWTREKRRHTKGTVKLGWGKTSVRSHWPGKGGLMRETDYLMNSLKYVEGMGWTGVRASAHYAGVHNCPKPGMTYGNGFGGLFSPPKPVVQRQFMGHSTKIDDFIMEYEDKYLFSTIFRAPV